MIDFREGCCFTPDQMVTLYRAIGWSAAEKPDALWRALNGSAYVVSAWEGDTMVGLGNAITDGALVVYYPHILVLPDYQGQGIGAGLLARLMQRFEGFHQHMLVAESSAVAFYERHGFTRAGDTVPMWIYAGGDH
jgi:GNAT superfamily N-acetyltransferase